MEKYLKNPIVHYYIYWIKKVRGDKYADKIFDYWNEEKPTGRIGEYAEDLVEKKFIKIYSIGKWIVMVTIHILISKNIFEKVRLFLMIRSWNKNKIVD